MVGNQKEDLSASLFQESAHHNYCRFYENRKNSLHFSIFCLTNLGLMTWGEEWRHSFLRLFQRKHAWFVHGLKMWLGNLKWGKFYTCCADSFYWVLNEMYPTVDVSDNIFSGILCQLVVPRFIGRISYKLRILFINGQLIGQFMQLFISMAATTPIWKFFR